MSITTAKLCPEEIQPQIQDARCSSGRYADSVQKLSRYRTHLRGLYHAKRLFRLFAEICSIAFVMLVMSVLDNFNPKFSAHAMAELHQGIQHGNLNDRRTLRGPPD